MRWLLALLFLPCVAWAAPPCYPFGIKGESQFKADWFKRTDNGWYAFWICKGTDALWTGYGLYCRHGVCAQGDWIESQLAVGQAADKAGLLDALYAKLVIAPDCLIEIKNNTANAPICRDLTTAATAVVTALNPPPAPAPTGWAVKASGTATTRVVYAYIAATNKRGALTGQTVAVGSPCDSSIRVDERIGTLLTTYMGVPGGIAVCEAK